MRHPRLATAILLATTGLVTSGCSDRFGWTMPPEMPTEPFSIDCRLTNASVGSQTIRSGELPDPAALTIQINPRQGYYRVTSYSGSLPNYYEIYRIQLDRNNKMRDASPLLNISPSQIPYIGSVNNSVSKYRYGVDRNILFLDEAGESVLSSSTLKHTAFSWESFPYMKLDVKNRNLMIGLELADGKTKYKEYLNHNMSEPVTARFFCARSPKGTVIEVEGFRQ